jgi:hypothetical protein
VGLRCGFQQNGRHVKAPRHAVLKRFEHVTFAKS